MEYLKCHKCGTPQQYFYRNTCPKCTTHARVIQGFATTHPVLEQILRNYAFGTPDPLDPRDIDRAIHQSYRSVLYNPFHTSLYIDEDTGDIVKRIRLWTDA